MQYDSTNQQYDSSGTACVLIGGIKSRNIIELRTQSLI